MQTRPWWVPKRKSFSTMSRTKIKACSFRVHSRDFSLSLDRYVFQRRIATLLPGCRSLNPQKGNMKPNRLKSWMLLWLLALLWGFSFFGFGWPWKTFHRFIWHRSEFLRAAFLIWAYVQVAHRNRAAQPLGHWLYAGLLGLIGNAIPFCAINWGLQKADSVSGRRSDGHHAHQYRFFGPFLRQ